MLFHTSLHSGTPWLWPTLDLLWKVIGRSANSGGLDDDDDDEEAEPVQKRPAQSGTWRSDQVSRPWSDVKGWGVSRRRSLLSAPNPFRTVELLEQMLGRAKICKRNATKKVGGWESDSAFDDFFFGSLTVSRIERTQRSGYSRPQARFAPATKRVAWGALETGKLEACGMLFLLYVMVFILEIILLYAGVQLNFAFSLPFQSL